MKKYSDLFEDEASELLRELTIEEYIMASPSVSYRKAAAVNEDGLTASGCGLFRQYLNGTPSGVYNTKYMIGILSHSEFSISQI